MLSYKGRVVLPKDSPWIPKFFAEFHATPSGGHSGAFRTYRRMASSVYWPGMTKSIATLVAACDVCQRNKYESKCPAGLLQPLPIPDTIWTDISMDFITGLPRSGGIDCIFVVVDRLSKYCHFMGLRHPYTAKTVADVFVQEVFRLHGMPASIVSDRDPVFLSSFWKELFRSAGTKLRMSSAYHPETDGQTEVMNRCLETYLRCFASERPKGWSKWLAWAEFCFNTGFQTSAGMTPFEAVYGRPPPPVIPFLPGEIRVQAVADSLRERDQVMRHLRVHLERAQTRMVREANKHRRALEFQVGDRVFLKFRPYRQRSLFAISRQKLAPRFFGPYVVEERIGAAAYRLALPPGSKVHPIFHVSLLKPAVGTDVASPALPDALMTEDPEFVPEQALQRRVVHRNGAEVVQVLLKWRGFPEEESSWEDVAVVRGQFPEFNLEDKVVSTGGVIDSTPQIKVYERRKKAPIE